MADATQIANLTQQAALQQANLIMQNAQLKRALFEARLNAFKEIAAKAEEERAMKTAKRKKRQAQTTQMGALAGAAIGAGFLAPALAPAATGGALSGAGVGSAATSAGMSVGELAAATGLSTAPAAANAIFSPGAMLNVLGLEGLMDYATPTGRRRR